MTHKTKRLSVLTTALTLVLLITLAAMSAGAATLSYTVSDTIPLTLTDWDDLFSVAQFDPTLGTLLSVELTLEGDVQGDIKEESLDNQARVITASLSTAITANPGFGSLSVTVNPAANQMFNATAYDGVLDFAGTSGASFLGLTGSDTDSISDNSAATLTGFTGPGTINIAADAMGDSTATGSGNLITQFTTYAAAELTVKYTYDDGGGGPNEVPEPGTYAMLGAGLTGLALLRRRMGK